MAWADRRVMESLRSAPAAQAEALPLLAHLLAAEHVWLARLEQRESIHSVWPVLSLEECDSLATENEYGYRVFIEGVGEGKLDATIRYRTSQGQELVCSVLDILTQVVTHGPYHRGQIAKAIGRVGGVAVNTDFITFVIQTEPIA